MPEATGRLTWDDTGKRYYETGVSQGVLYVTNEDGSYGAGISWNGLSNVSESPSGAEPTDLYADDIKYLSLQSAEDFSCTIEAYQSPEEFDACDGLATLAEGVTIAQQTRKKFGFSYKTKIGNDTKGNDYGYKLHLVYGCQASPSEKGYSTINDSPEAITLSWEVNTTPVNVSGHKPTAHLIIDSTKVDPIKMKALEDVLYGTNAGEGGTPPATAAKLPLPDEVVALVADDGSDQ